MKLSILDQSPASSGKTAQQALHDSLSLAQAGEKLGYTRYWIAEHHDFPGLTCPAPEVMLGYIGGQTETIRLGSGAVLLPHYKPYKVAETYNLLAALFPGRIDVGIGRAPGGSAEATMALSDNYLEQVRKMPESVDTLLHFFKNDFPSDDMFSKITPSPVPDIHPEPWILGTSKKSAILAAKHGLSYAFGQFMSDQDVTDIIDQYKSEFRSNNWSPEPNTIAAVSVLCAETKEEAEDLALPNQIWKIQLAKGEGRKGVPSLGEAKHYSLTPEEKEMLNSMKKRSIIGSPSYVKRRLEELREHYQADEMMIVTITHDIKDRVRSYELIANECLACST
ncbi:LLM class flavin-dependent oxidoreductase [Fictibacillus sp. KU28468]|uniref:LLM class flavin-dependent oxidoreductase n=1 Tax=Fictibacillus sp. KU28468 TaxID=2991053 RepID=UPI00223E38C3|nr:LLM class flavin-dependent oxidoreductase [Fictibacillus sp. KU28468]UZJ80130.1 LLM class flavin-dependent oxidoreductase [Fictibacillus sp. KU28468]